jgi:hypothetical protein
MTTIFRYDLAACDEPRVILITDDVGSRRAVPRLSYVVLPANNRLRWVSSEYRSH